MLSPKVIEKNAKTGKPCTAKNDYLVSMTSDVSVDGGWGRVGDCDQSKWIDALEIPALVLPQGNTEFEALGAKLRNFVVAMTLGDKKRLAFGIVGDRGPATELGEASVAMNRLLNGMAEGAIPSNYEDAKARFQAPRSVILIFPTEQHRAKRPLTAKGVEAEALKRFTAWGGQQKLESCLSELD